MKKRLAVLLMTVTAVTVLFTGCGNRESPAASENVTEESTEAAAEEADSVKAENSGSDTDQEAADAVAALIDAIYVQQRTENTDAQCEEAKAAWDALTDEQKEMVEGEEASPDYFGLDTGDSSKDDPRNQDDIGENELLVVSFGTSYNDSRSADIKGIEDALQAAYPDWSVRRAFTAQIIINHVQARDGEKIDNVQQALERAAANGVKNLVIQPTHLMHGAEYDELMETVETYRDQFGSVKVAEPLLGEVGADASVVNADKAAVAEAVVTAAVAEAGYGSAAEAQEDGTAFVFLGHGTSHTAKVSYSQMQTQLTDDGCVNGFIGTVEGEPEETTCEAVIEAISAAGYKKVILRPLMVVAGDHANNDMAGDEDDSWKSMFTASGRFESVETQISGLGRIPAIQEIYKAHTEAVIGTASLEDGVYTAAFDSDSSMFHVNEAYDGKGTLTVKDGEMTLHISLPSKNIVNLFLGLAEDAQKEDAALLEPTIDTVTYSDGTTEEVHGFDIPVPVLEEEFDLALLGTKGKWYDHKVKVSDPVKKSVLEDGEYTIDVTMEGGSGRAGIASPAALFVKDGRACAHIVWSSPNYDYMKVGSMTYTPIDTEGNSKFEIPVNVFDEKIKVTADTTAMGTPHEITYSLTFHSDSLKLGQGSETAADLASTAKADGAVKAGRTTKANSAVKTDLGLTYDHSMTLDYAKGFSVDHYEGGYALITISGTDRFFIVPKGKSAPKDLPQDMTVLQQPVTNIYLAASAVMDMFAAMDAVDHIRLSGTKEEDWYVEEAREAMSAGALIYAGKYNMPDYERILDSDCGLAIESTMILHAPEVKENLEALGIPVLIDRSSYEAHPLGRTEWVKLYGVLAGREEEAEEAFDGQKKAFTSVKTNVGEKTKTAAFFYITSNGAVSVRKSGDYVPKMIELAGGEYVFSDLGDDTASSSVNMQMEEFYAEAKDADYLVYNSTIDGGVNSLKELLGKNPLLADFKAYTTGNIFCTTRDLYQESMEAGTFIRDLHRMFTAGDGEDEGFSYLFRLK